MLKSSNSFSMPPLKKGDRIKGGQYEIIDNTVNEGALDVFTVLMEAEG